MEAGVSKQVFTTPEDLRPLLDGGPDPRMDDLKQALIDLDYEARLEGEGRTRQLFKEFFDIIGLLTVGVKLEFGEIDTKTYTILLKTDDGQLPLEVLSQGTHSLMGWVGLLIQRLYDVYRRADVVPREEPAVVLIDEIDAHMHPLWQQTIVYNLSRSFPKVQFLATTHSPMIVGGMNVKQVIRFARDSNGRVERVPIEEDMLIGRADQLLTSKLFSLETTIDKTTQDTIKQIQDLLAKPERTDNDERLLTKLRQTLEVRIPVPQETPVERRAQELLHALLEEQVGDVYPEVKERVMKKAEQLFAELQAREGQRR